MKLVSASHGSYHVSRNLHILQRSKKGVSAEETPSYRKKPAISVSQRKIQASEDRVDIRTEAISLRGEGPRDSRSNREWGARQARKMNNIC